MKQKDKFKIIDITQEVVDAMQEASDGKNIPSSLSPVLHTLYNRINHFELLKNRIITKEMLELIVEQLSIMEKTKAHEKLTVRVDSKSPEKIIETLKERIENYYKAMETLKNIESILKNLQQKS